MEPKLAMSLNYVCFLVIGFYWHKNFSFLRSNVVPSKLKFFIVHCSAYLINLILLFLFVDLLQLNHQYVQGFAVIFVAIYLYLMLNRVVFKTINETIKGNDSI